MPPSRIKVNANQIADLAKIPLDSVHKFFMGMPGVAEHERREILRVMTELNISIPERLRAKVTTNTIAVIPNTSTDYIGHVYKGLTRTSEQFGYVLLPHNMNLNDLDEMVHEYESLIQNGGSQGLIILIPHAFKKMIALCRQYNHPYVTIDYEDDTDAALNQTPMVNVTNRQGLVDVVRHLVGLGHRRIGFITGMLHMKSASERLLGYEDGLKEAGIPVDSALIAEGDWSHDMAAKLTRQLMQLKNPPTAIAASNDIEALAVIETLQAMGLKVGDDVSVTGYDDIAIASEVTPTLTTVRQPMEALGTAAIELLHTILKGEEPDPLHVLMPTELVVRNSTGPVKSKD